MQEDGSPGSIWKQDWGSRGRTGRKDSATARLRGSLPTEVSGLNPVCKADPIPADLLHATSCKHKCVPHPCARHAFPINAVNFMFCNAHPTSSGARSTGAAFNSFQIPTGSHIGFIF